MTAAHPASVQQVGTGVTVRLSKAASKDVQIVEAPGEEITVSPILASFLHGMPRSVDTLTFQATWTEEPQRKRRRLSLSSETSYIKYHTAQPDVSQKGLASYLMGVFSKQKQEVVLHPLEAVVPVTQTIKALNQQKRGENEAQAVQPSYLEQRRSLVNTFGTKKKKSAVQSREASRISADAVVGAGALDKHLTESAKEIAKQQSVQSGADAAEAGRNILLPPHDTSTKRLDHAYPLPRMFSEVVWESLSEEVAQLLSDSQDDPPSTFIDVAFRQWGYWPEYVKALFTAAASVINTSSDTSEPFRLHLRTLLLLRHLFDLKRQPYVHKSGLSRLAKVLRTSDAVAQAFLSTFYVQECSQEGREPRFIRSKAIDDKLILHIAVLCLIVGGYDNVPIGRIAGDLDMTHSDLKAYFRETGASVKSTLVVGQANNEPGRRKKNEHRSELIAKLTVPLSFPQVQRYRHNINRR